MKKLSKSYQPQENEDTIYKQWENSGYFNPDVLDLPKNAPSYTIVLPPPNITDRLHLGHSSMLAIEDLLIRYHRMNGYRTLWIPGTDHAAIATQNVVEKKILAETGETRHMLGREKFLEKVWEFLKETQATILNQTRKMGASLDWSREAFTLDEPRQKAVTKMFVDMYKAGVIYQGERIVNWCPRCNSTLADDEVEHVDQKTMFYTFRYWKDFPIAISTTRLETKIGDTAVAVNPKDERYKKFIGKRFTGTFCGIPLKIKVIADREVDMKLGTGALGVTPAHSMVDWKMAEDNNLAIKKVINEAGNIHEGFEKFSGLTTKEARLLIVKKLQKEELIEKEEEINNALSVCYRCNTAIEPLPSKQWFINVDKKLDHLGKKSLKEKAIEVVNKKDKVNDEVRESDLGRINFIPSRFEKQYINWMENLHDWCISRQIWFGHRIPVWYRTAESQKSIKFTSSKNLKLKSKQEIYVGTKSPRNNYDKVVLLHAWDSSPKDAFFPWLKKELENRGLKVKAPQLPNAKNPNYTEWLAKFKKLNISKNTLVVGRSLGATLTLAAAQEGYKIGKLVAVCTPLDNDTISNFFEDIGKWKFDKIKKNIANIEILHSTNDPYITNKISKKLSSELDASLTLVENANHFTGNNYQEILDACNLWTQDSDVLDTWFSAGMWTFSTLGWPDNFKDGEKMGDLANFHPTQVLETGYEILTLWVSRMIMMSLFAIGEIPFKDVYLHGMVLDKDGKKMSKSKGNGINPIDVIEKFGTDAVRLSLLIGNTPGNDLRIGEEKIEGMRNLVNKLWNICRYTENNFSISEIENKQLSTLLKSDTLTTADKWIIVEFTNLITKLTNDIKNYRLSEGGEKLKEFTWNNLADWYLEISKIEENAEDKKLILKLILQDLLKLWHPFIPFVTEKIWQELFSKKSLMIQQWPTINSYPIIENSTINKNFNLLKKIITVIRNIRAHYQLKPSQKIDLIIYGHQNTTFIKKQASLITSLHTNVNNLTIQERGEKLSQSHYESVHNLEIYVPLQTIINIKDEKKRLAEEINQATSFITSINKKLRNNQFITNAPKEIIVKEQKKLATQKTKLKNLKEHLENIQ